MPEEHLRRSVEHFIVLDFDRCIGNTVKLQALLEEVVTQETPVTHAQMRRAREATERSGGSFDTAQHVREQLHGSGDDAGWDRLADRYVRRARQQDMLEPGARELVALLQEKQVDYGIVTYGGELWQTTKILAARLEETPYVVTPSKGKGELIAGWRQDDGEFLIPAGLSSGESLSARSVMLIDDKAASFEKLPPGAVGIYVLPGSGQAQLLSQQGSVPESVVTVRGLGEALPVVLAYLETGELIDKA